MIYGKIIFYFMKVNLIFILTFEEYDIMTHKEFLDITIVPIKYFMENIYN